MIRDQIKKPIVACIDIQATIDKYGYSPINLALASHKKVIAVCGFCLTQFKTGYFQFNLPSSLGACKNCDAIASVYARNNSAQNKHEFYLSKRPKIIEGTIDNEATKAKYGYFVQDLASSSHKRIIAICAYCNVRVDMLMSKYTVRGGHISCKNKNCVWEKTKVVWNEKYGTECPFEIPSVKTQLANPKTEQIVAGVLTDRYKIPFIRNHIIGPYEFDFFLPEHNLLIECQGDYYHNFKEHGYSGLPKDRAKSSYVESQTGHKLVWIYEHEIHIGRINKILDYHIHGVTEPAVSFQLKELIFRSISSHDAHVFLSQYHYLGNVGMVSMSFGAYYNDILVAVCVFGGVTRNQSIKKVNTFLNTNFGPKELRELRRFCINPSCRIDNLGSYCMKKFVDILKHDYESTKAILSFSDQTVNDEGTLYKASNWTLMHKTGKSYHYMDPKTNRLIHKKTIWDLAQDAHMPERDFAASTGMIRVEEMPKKVWVKKL